MVTPEISKISIALLRQYTGGSDEFFPFQGRLLYQDQQIGEMMVVRSASFNFGGYFNGRVGNNIAIVKACSNFDQTRDYLADKSLGVDSVLEIKDIDQPVAELIVIRRTVSLENNSESIACYLKNEGGLNLQWVHQRFTPGNQIELVLGTKNNNKLFKAVLTDTRTRIV